MQKSIAVDLSRSDDDDHLLRDIALSIIKAAQHHDSNTLDRLRTVPGIGKILRLVLVYAIHALARLPRVQEFAASGRLVQGAQASAGKRSGTAGTKIGQAPRTWAFSEAAVLCLRDTPAGQNGLVRLEKTHGHGNALTSFAPKLARAVYDRLKRQTAFHRHSFCRDSRRGVDKLDASLDPQGMNLLLNALQRITACVDERGGAYRALSLRLRVD